jgi:hypothetical protein
MVNWDFKCVFLHVWGTNGGKREDTYMKRNQSVVGNLTGRVKLVSKKIFLRYSLVKL